MKPKIKMRKKVKVVLLTVAVLIVVAISTFLFLLYGPYKGFREWLITSAMTTMNHQYLAKWFYSDEEIQKVLDKNKVIDSDEDTNLGDINFVEDTNYKDEYERAILKRDANNNDYKIIKLKDKGYEGYLVAIYDPSRIATVTTDKIGERGQYLTKLATNEKAYLAINGGNFEDPNNTSNGANPIGVTISRGVVKTSSPHNHIVVGFNNENKLIIDKGVNMEKALALQLRDAVTALGPRIVTNGKPAQVFGNGGWGKAPRTAIGQRQDGVVLFLVLDGRLVTRPGADMNDLVEIMLRYGAYNAVNLDGGTSSALVVDNVLVNDPIDGAFQHKTRPIATGFILNKDESNNGDKTAVADKLK